MCYVCLHDHALELGLNYECNGEELLILSSLLTDESRDNIDCPSGCVLLSFVAITLQCICTAPKFM